MTNEEIETAFLYLSAAGFEKHEISELLKSESFQYGRKIAKEKMAKLKIELKLLNVKKGADNG